MMSILNGGKNPKRLVIIYGYIHVSVVIKNNNFPLFLILNTQLMKFDYIKICEFESADTNCLNEFKCKVIKFLSSTRFT